MKWRKKKPPTINLPLTNGEMEIGRIVVMPDGRIFGDIAVTEWQNSLARIQNLSVPIIAELRLKVDTR